MRKEPCIICKKDHMIIERYPNAVFNKCSSQTQTKNGMEINFGNIDLSGGFVSYIFQAGSCEEGEEHICYIDGIKCYADESRFGGVVIQVV